jgi:hypothetical protein
MKAILLMAAISSSALIANDAHAQPSWEGFWNGSFYHIKATNNQSRNYTCSFAYEFSYSDFGERKTMPVSGNFTVFAQTSGIVHTLQGSWVSPQIVSGPSVRCQ